MKRRHTPAQGSGSPPAKGSWCRRHRSAAAWRPRRGPRAEGARVRPRGASVPRLAGSLVLALWVATMGAAAPSAHAGPVGGGQAWRMDAAAQALVWLEEAEHPWVALAAMQSLQEALSWTDAPVAMELLQRAEELLPLRWRWWPRLERARILEAGGAFEEADRLYDASGFLRQWAVVGPFANHGMTGLRHRWPPELGLGAGDEVAGRTAPVGWLPLPAFPQDAVVLPGAAAQPDVGSVHYLAVEISATRAQDALLALQVAGAWRAWWRGAPVAEQPEDLGGALPRDVVRLSLPRGAGVLVLKVATEERPSALIARLSAPDGGALQGVTWRAPAAGIAALAEWPAIADGGPALEVGDLFAEDAALRCSDEPHLGSSAGALCAAAEAWLRHRAGPRDRRRPWAAPAQRALANPDLLDARAWWWLGEMADLPWTRLERWARAGDEAGLTLQERRWRARWRSVDQQEREALWLGLRELRSAQPYEGRWRLLEANALADLGLGGAALAALESILADVGPLPPVLDALERLVRQHRREDLQSALAWYRWQARQHDLDAWAEANRWPRVASTEREHQRARERMEARFGDNAAWWQAEARRLRARGEDRAAGEALRRAVALRPGDASLWEALGRAHLAIGEEQAAIEAWSMALVHAPQRQELRDLLAVLAPAQERFYQRWVRSAAALAAAAPQPMDAEADYEWLVDQQVVQVHENGLSARWIQQIARVSTRRGAEELRNFGVAFTPNAQRVDILRAEVHGPGGQVRQRLAARDVRFNQGPAAIYFDVQERRVDFERLEPGDVVVWEVLVSDTAPRNLFEDYFGDLWLAQDGAPRHEARYVLIAPDTLPLHWNDASWRALTRREEAMGARRVHVVQGERIPRVPAEPFSPGWSERGEYVHVSTYESWSALADWYRNLIREQLVLSPEMEALVEGIVAVHERPEDRLAALYGWVVRNVRYVSLSFGIHGFRPYRSHEVFQRRYGDCKDTATLLHMLLRRAGIATELVLIRTRDLGRVGHDPPSLAVFNHMILYAPAWGLYLDGTASHAGAWEVPWMDQGATALHLHAQGGGTLVETPVQAATTQGVQRTMRVDLRGDEAVLRGHWVAYGGLASGWRRAWESADGRMEALQQALARWTTGLTPRSLEVVGADTIDRSVELRFEAVGASWWRGEGDVRSLLPLGGPSRWVERLAPTSTRRLPWEGPGPQRVEERWEFVLPAGWEVDRSTLPAADEGTAFGTYVVTSGVEEGVLLVDFALHLDADRLDPSAYEAFRAWLEGLDRRLAVQVVVRWTQGGT